MEKREIIKNYLDYILEDGKFSQDKYGIIFSSSVSSSMLRLPGWGFRFSIENFNSYLYIKYMGGNSGKTNEIANMLGLLENITIMLITNYVEQKWREQKL